MTRKEANMEIIRLLVLEINQFPDLRFGQLLRNIGVIEDYFDEKEGALVWRNGFYEESTEIFQRMIDQLKGKRAQG